MYITFYKHYVGMIEFFFFKLKVAIQISIKYMYYF